MGGRERTRRETREREEWRRVRRRAFPFHFFFLSNHKSHTHKKNRVFFPRFCLFSFFAGRPQREEDILLTCLMNTSLKI